MVAIVDYGVGNLFSLVSSLRAIGQEAEVTSDPAAIRAADRVILPGVGAFGDAVEKLNASGLRDVVLECAAAGKPLMGICLGMQMLFEKSFEFGEHEGLGLLKGQVVPMEGRLPAGLKIPHIGWNALRFEKESPLFRYIGEGDCVYFVHSFYAEGCADSLIADTEYGRPITAAVQRDNVFGCQFHPEKSGSVGLNILRAFCEV
ncbi:MAG: imidazole glycerol phosphate synthase subunit HisH [Oscillospiraceae bacterium]|nr:imidazole glycerol phosphate synthase subunit HisH [Oscillospiraceae bacterium]